MERKQFLRMMGITTGGMAVLGPALLDKLKMMFPEAEQEMPALFAGHGNPMNALYDNSFTRSLHDLGKKLPRPKAILMVSAHWLTRGTFLATAEKPETIHDFGGFPEELYKVQYPAQGQPEMAALAASLLPGSGLDPRMGLDHGAWSVLRHMYPAADVPVFQLSLDYAAPPEKHFEWARQLKSLRKRGILIMGSGNIVHNLGRFEWKEDAVPYDWAVEFDAKVKHHIDNRDFTAVVRYEEMGSLAKMAVPTNDHYLPLLYPLAVAGENEKITYPYEQIMNGSIAMRCVQVG